MPRYDFRCRQCGDTFEVNRPMAQAGDAASCPQGHTDTVKLLSAFAVSRGSASAAAPAAPPAPSSGGCCGGGGCC